NSSPGTTAGEPGMLPLCWPWGSEVPFRPALDGLGTDRQGRTVAVANPQPEPGPRPVTLRLAVDPSGRTHLARGRRIAWALLTAVPVAVLVTAASLTPSPEGTGTHTQLGLPSCGFLMFTGFPCPGCGMTTAFAHMMRLEVVQAWSANPFGIVL